MPTGFAAFIYIVFHTKGEGVWVGGYKHVCVCVCEERGDRRVGCHCWPNSLADACNFSLHVTPPQFLPSVTRPLSPCDNLRVLAPVRACLFTTQCPPAIQ